jgi:hypothetical protein
MFIFAATAFVPAMLRRTRPGSRKATATVVARSHQSLTLLVTDDVPNAMPTDYERGVLGHIVNDSPRRIIRHFNNKGVPVNMAQARALQDFGITLSILLGLREQGKEVPQALHSKLERLQAQLPKPLQKALQDLADD